VTWLLDTNVLIHAQRGHPAHVTAQLSHISPDEVAISSVTVAELWYGAAKSPDPERKKKAWLRVLAAFAVLPFDRASAELHGELRHALRKHQIGERDLLIACIALANDLTLVSTNVGEFGRVPGLHVEDWSR
jgi:tRNA(fMet)-specific endonuclease VapC